MQDMFNLPQAAPPVLETWMSAPRLGTAWYTWEVPRGVNMLYMLLVGGGGLGGLGASAASGNRGGGGGGGAGAITRLMIAAKFLPDILYIQPGTPGDPNISTTGGASSVTIFPRQTTGIVVATANGGSPGLAGTTSVPGGGASGGTGTTVTAVACHGIFQSATGQAGANGGAVAGGNGTTIAAFVNGPFTGGAGGAGTSSANFAGGNVTSPDTNYWPTLAGGAGGSNRGTDGTLVNAKSILWSYGGSGGGSASAAAGGGGGNGGPGSGGGGGGAGTSAGVRGLGGTGFIIIAGW